MRTKCTVLLLLLLGCCAARPALADQNAPVALDKWSRYHTNITAYMPHTTVPKGKKVVWVPRVSLVFKVTDPESDDVVLLQHYRGRAKWGPEVVCSLRSGQIVKRRGRGGKEMGYALVVPECVLDVKHAISKSGKFSVKVSYKQTGRGRVHRDLATYHYTVKTYNTIWPGKGGPTKGYYVDHDFRMGEAWAYLDGDGKLRISSWFKFDRKTEQHVRGGRMRCYLGDKKITFHDYPTQRTVNAHQHYATRDTNQKVQWGLWYWWSARNDDKATADWLKENAGNVRCTLTQAGDIAREFTFTVGDDGLVQRPPCQREGAAHPVRTVAEEALIHLTFKKGQDLKFDRAAYKKSGLYGKGWDKGCPP